MFKLSFLGKGAAFYPQYGNTNAWFEQEEDLYCIDCGEEAFGKLARTLKLEKYKNIYVLLTHLHADHSGSLASLCSYVYYVLRGKVTIVHPEEQVVTLLTCQGIKRDQYHLLKKLPEDKTVQVEFREVQHADDMKAYGMILSCPDEKIYYSGDAAYLLEEIVSEYLSGKISKIYHDTSSKESESHCYYRRLEAMIPRERRNQVYCMHLDGDYADILKESGFSVVEAD